MQSGKRKQVAKGFLLLALSVALLNIPVLEASAQDTANAAVNVDTSAPKVVTTPAELERWMEFYYLHPQPDLLVSALQYADSSGMVKQGEAPLTAFVSRVFAQNPKSIPGWVAQLKNLSPASKPMLWSSLWWSNTIEGKAELNKLATTYTSTKDQDAVLGQMAKPSLPIEQLELNRPEVLDELWGAYSATGDDKYLNRLITTLPWLTENGGDYIKLTLAGAAKWSLVSNAKIHQKVLASLMKARQDQPAIRRTIDAIIAEAQSKTPANQQASTRATQ